VADTSDSLLLPSFFSDSPFVTVNINSVTLLVNSLGRKFSKLVVLFLLNLAFNGGKEVNRMKRIAALVIAGSLVLATTVPALANPSPPTNGGSANGGGSSGQCTGANADRPAACHNSHGAGN
jgi:hypothetical protein